MNWKYAKCIECERELMKDSMYGLNGSYVCENCVNGQCQVFGKMERYRNDPEEMAKALILRAWTLIGDEDDSMSQDGWGWIGRFDNVDGEVSYVVKEDSQGFFEFEEYLNTNDLDKDWDSWYDDGWGFQEDDFVIHEDGDVYSNQKRLHIWPNKLGEISDRRRLAAIRLEMFKSGCYPNVWQEQRYGLSIVKNLGF